MIQLLLWSLVRRNVARVRPDCSKELKLYTEGGKSKKEGICFMQAEGPGEEGDLPGELRDERELEREAAGKSCEKRRGQERETQETREEEKRLNKKNKKMRENRGMRT